MATAKGLCYILNKPLITINTLQMMANAAKTQHADFLCPMIDARRMDVFTAIFDRKLNYMLPPSNIILGENSFHDFLEKNTLLFFGNGSAKFRLLIKHPNALFAAIESDARAMANLSYESFIRRNFANVAYSQPFYGKDFHSSVK
jgi:tRNA threonylcarbamoyladenosine biosynthesis protein TsaB